MKVLDFEEWLKLGFDNGWVGPPVCSTHDGIPSGLEEDDEFEDGDEPCIHILRLYADTDEKIAVESNHAPSVWRATNRGWV